MLPFLIDACLRCQSDNKQEECVGKQLFLTYCISSIKHLQPTKHPSFNLKPPWNHGRNISACHMKRIGIIAPSFSPKIITKIKKNLLQRETLICTSLICDSTPVSLYTMLLVFTENIKGWWMVNARLCQKTRLAFLLASPRHFDFFIWETGDFRVCETFQVLRHSDVICKNKTKQNKTNKKWNKQIGSSRLS